MSASRLCYAGIWPRSSDYELIVCAYRAAAKWVMQKNLLFNAVKHVYHLMLHLISIRYHKIVERDRAQEEVLSVGDTGRTKSTEPVLVDTRRQFRELYRTALCLASDWVLDVRYVGGKKKK